MATQYTMDNAEWASSDDVQFVRTDQGGFIAARNENPWMFVRFADEVNRFVVPINGCSNINTTGGPVPKVAAVEVMPYMPWPLESGRPARTSDPRDSVNAGGPVAVHFYTWF